MPRYSTLRVALRTEVPAGQFATREHLLRRGFTVASVQNLLKSGDLESLARGFYTQPEPLTVAGIVRSLQRMGSDLVIGGSEAMRLHGILASKPAELFSRVTLSGLDRPPAWLFNWDKSVRFDHLRTKRLFNFGKPADGASLDRFRHHVSQFGWMGVTFQIANVERALFEMLSEVPSRVSFATANNLMGKLSGTSRQREFRQVLEQCVSVKVKRLFLWHAEQLEYGCVDGLQIGQYIGTGKRQVVKGGRYVKKYLMTVPR